MRHARLPRQVLAIVLVLSAVASLAPPRPAAAAAGDTTADRVLGQADMAHGLANAGGGVGGVGVDTPAGVVVDPLSGRVFVSDFTNNRVLGWPNSAAFSNGQAADLVLGQADFTSHAANRGGAPDATTLNNPASVAVDDRTGNLFVSDNGNNRVLEYTAPITTNQAASRVFGQGGSFVTVNANKGGVSANGLNGPRGLAVDDGGFVYLADSQNNRVLIYAPSGDTTADIVLGQSGSYTTTAANNGSGTPNAGGFDGPFGLAVQGVHDGATTSSLDLVVSDHNNNRVLLFRPFSDLTAEGVYGQGGSYVTGTANKSGPSANSLNDPRGLAFDAGQNLYVADLANHRVLRFDASPANTTADGVLGQDGSFLTTSANQGGPISADTLNHPVAVTVDAGQNLLVVDRDNNRVLRFDRPLANPAPVVGVLVPGAVAVGGPAFNLVVTGNHFVKGSVVQWDGANRPTTFISPQRLVAAITAADVSDILGGVVKVVTPGPGGGNDSQNMDLYFGLRHDTTADAVLGQPNFQTTIPIPLQLANVGASSLNASEFGLAIDPHSGRLWVSDTADNRVLSWPNAAAFSNSQPADKVIGQPDLLRYGAHGGSSGLNKPAGLAVDEAGNLYVADTSNNRVLEFNAPATTDAVADRVFGQASLTGTTANYSGINALGLSSPYGVALDPSGNLVVADTANNRTLIYNAPLSSDAAADVVLGQAGFSTNLLNRGNAEASAGSQSFPPDVVYDRAGRLYLADFGNNRVLIYPPGIGTGGVATAVIGQTNMISNTIDAGGNVSATGLDSPEDIAVDGDNNVYVSDTYNNRVLEYDDPLAPGGNFSADRVFGQTSFITNTANDPYDASPTRLNFPTTIALDAQADLLVNDSLNARVLEYLTPVEQQLRLYLPLLTR